MMRWHGEAWQGVKVDGVRGVEGSRKGYIVGDLCSAVCGSE